MGLKLEVRTHFSDWALMGLRGLKFPNIQFRGFRSYCRLSQRPLTCWDCGVGETWPPKNTGAHQAWTFGNQMPLFCVQ